jgi:hypothetical protein
LDPSATVTSAAQCGCGGATILAYVSASPLDELSIALSPVLFGSAAAQPEGQG